MCVNICLRINLFHMQINNRQIGNDSGVKTETIVVHFGCLFITVHYAFVPARLKKLAVLMILK